ncbi:MAG: aldehyde dehydrogenase family protein [Rhizomicrobium sp.]
MVHLDQPRPSLDHILNRRHKMLIGGAWVDARDGGLIDVEDPATGEIIAHAAAGESADIDAAVKAARRAFEGPWSRLAPMQRTALMLKLADILEAHSEEFAHIETFDVGQPLAISRPSTLGAPNTLRYFAGWASKLTGETMTPLVPGNWHAYTLREPVGVVGLIVPWNAPYTSTLNKLGALLAAGCTVVIKPAEQTPLATVRMGEFIQQAGFPDGVVNIVTGYGHTAGDALVRHPDVDKISFTGSTETGKLVLKTAAETMKRVTLELGGKSPIVILPDADLDKAIEAAALGIYRNSGQICVAGSRLFAHRDVFDRVVDGVAAYADRMKVGPGLEPGVEIGPLVSRVQMDRVVRLIGEGRSDGARVVTGGDRIGDKGYFVRPTVLVDTTPQMSVRREEIFGPVLCAASFADNDLEAIARDANDTSFGLAATIWTRDISAAHKLAKMIKAGSIKINSREFPEQSMPFGGLKQSGIGRERGREGVEEYTELKSVIVGL